MITPIHIVFNSTLAYAAHSSGIIDINHTDLILLFSAELIDIDHLFSKPIYHPRRNPFKTHFSHKRWKIILVTSIVLILFHPVMFLGVGLMSHLLLDYLYTKIYKMEK